MWNLESCIVQGKERAKDLKNQWRDKEKEVSIALHAPEASPLRNVKRSYKGKKLWRWRSTQESFLIGRRPIRQRSFSAEYAKTGCMVKRREPGWRELSWGWTRLTPQCSPTPARPEAPFESSLPLLPLARSHLTTPSRRFQPLPCLPLVFSLGRVLRETLFGSFDFLILSSLFPFFSFSFSFGVEALALQVSAAPTSRTGWRARGW